MKRIRVGHGYDVHRLTEGRLLFLGGVEIPYEKGLLGHSDADVLLHAVMDAALGALALGDIGKLFPDTSDEYLGIDSKKLCLAVAERIAAQGYEIGNVDATVIAQKPRLSPYIPQMSEVIASLFGLAVGDVSIKATTEEGLGFTGQGEGIAAHAVCLCYPKD
ncbi:MAG: 2-C-methyl-D-erythritol 2,4-cyclodiphosphate synthase [Clostridia bacterium]|nr:2-C-methyl-D-erythritol 2,4-cyclodiphosphate synthase [Clostridia bacterium]